MKGYTVFLIVTVFLTYAFGQHPGETQQEIGTGARATALAGNHAALTSGIADLYWNPAALGFYVSREFQGSLYGFKQNSTSEFFGKTTDEDIQRFKLSETGMAFALPTSRGGISIAASYSNPVILDDAFSFSGSYDLNDSAVSARRDFRITGNLNFWTIGFGIQVAKNFSVGFAPSFINGKANSEVYFLKESSINQSVYETYDDYSATGTYNGLDMRAGLFYRGGSLFNIGARLVFPQIIRYIDDASGYYDNTSFSATDRYTMYSSYKGAIGASVMLRPCTITAEIRGTLPYDYLFPEKDISSSYQTGRYKTGAGIGIEAPVIVAPLLVRIGYSYDDLDLHPYVFDYATRYDDVLYIDWSDNGMKVNRDLHRLSAGIGYTASTFSYDLSYVFSTWGITTNKNLEQTYLMHRLQTTVSLRF